MWGKKTLYKFLNIVGFLLIGIFSIVGFANAEILFENSFEEGDTSAYPQPNIDIRTGNTLEVTNEHARTGNYSLEVSTGGIEPTAVIDQLFAKQNTLYQRTYISLPDDYNLEPGAAHNAIVLKTDDFRNLLWIVIGSDYRLSPVYFDSNGNPTFPGPFGPEIPRDGSWHEIQSRYTVDENQGHVQLWLDGELIAEFTDVNTGLAGRDDVHVVTWGSYFSTVSNNHTIYFDDVTVADEFIEGETSGSFITERIVGGLNLPTTAAFTPDGRILIGQKDGNIRVFKDGELLPTPLVTIPNVNTYQDRGLIGLAVDPNFETNGYIYVGYTHDVNPSDFTGPKTSRVIRLTVEGDIANLNTEQIILGSTVGNADNPSCNDFPTGTDCLPSDARTHSIGHMQFLPDGTLLIAHGDGAPDETVNTNALRSQNLDSLAGKLIRINPDGTAPANNPFFNGNIHANRSKVWAYGFRNPFRFGIDPDNGRVIAGDVGWGSWEELDTIEPGRNYGWPCYEANEFIIGYSAYQQCLDLQSSGTATAPIYFYAHPPGSAVVGGVFYKGNSYPTQYDNAFFFGDYARNAIYTLNVDAFGQLIPESVTTFNNSAGGPTYFFIGPDSDIYYIAIYTGELRRIRYVAGDLPPVAQASANYVYGSLPLMINFSSDGSFDPENEILNYQWDFGDGSDFSFDPNPTHTYTTLGIYDVILTISDILGQIGTFMIRVFAGNNAPLITIASPTEGHLYHVGETINFHATATDLEDGDLTDESLSWRILLHHCELITQTCHVHPFLEGTGSNGSFVAPDHGEGVSLEIVFTAEDSGTLTNTESITIYPELITVNLQSQPEGATIVLNGRNYVTPTTAEVTAGGTSSIFAPSSQSIDGVIYNFQEWSDSGEQNHTFTTSNPIMLEAIFASSDTQQIYWDSWDTIISETTSTASVLDSEGDVSAELELYESSNEGGISFGTPLASFSSSDHTEIFNNVSTFRFKTPGYFGDYPYVGKSTVVRGAAPGEIAIPSPTGVFDLQMSPPESDTLIVSSFIVPQNGEYSVSNLAARRVLGWGGTSSLKVFDNNGILIATITATGLEWTNHGTSYNLGQLSAGEKIYFAVDRDGDFVGDATEVAWRVTATIPSENNEPVLPIINSFTASQETILSGESTTLSWNTTNAESVTIDNGIGSVETNGYITVNPEVSTTYTLTANRGENSTTSSITITVDTGLQTIRTWNSWDIEILSGTPQAQVVSSESDLIASLQFYESINDGGVEQDGLLETYRGDIHPEGFNEISNYWIGSTGALGDYPYVGKSTSGRSEDNAPTPLDVLDLQMHAPENDRLIVAAFIAPESGEYIVSGLSARRVLGWGNTASFKVFDQNENLLATITADTTNWTTHADTYNLGQLSAGEKIYFAVDRDGDFVGDATEVAWSIRGIFGNSQPTPTPSPTPTPTDNSATWNSWDVTISESESTAQVIDTQGSQYAHLELYESSNDGGILVGNLLTGYETASHPEAFNNISGFRFKLPGDFGNYPYIGKSTIQRGYDSSEINAQGPLDVFDLQMSPPESDRLIVAAFIAPSDGEYSVSNLAARRVLSWGNTTSLKVFNSNGDLITTVTTTNREWIQDNDTYNLGQLSAGEKIYFAVDRDGDFVGDATEVAWSINLNP